MEIPMDGTPALPWPLDEDARSKLVDSFLLAGVFGHDSAKQTIDQLILAKDEVLAHEKQLLDADVALLDAELEKARAGQDSAALETEQLKSEAADIRGRVVKAGLELANLLSERAQLLRGLLSKRLSYPIRLLKKKQEAVGELARIVASLSIEEENNRLEYEKALHKIASERRNLNKDEYARRIAFLSGQRSAAESQFLRLDQYLESLRFFGLTRTTAGFMVWAGYISFTAFGWFAGDIIQRILGADKDSLPGFQQFVEMLASALQAGITQVGILWTALLILLIPLVPIALIGGLFWLVDWIMGKFDPQWEGRKGKRKSKETVEFSPWPQVPKVHRGDYTQVVGRLPFLYVWMLVPLLIAFLFTFPGRSRDGSALASPSVPGLLEPVDSFVFAFLGVVLCIMVASFVMLYATRIVEPRFRRMLANGEPVGFREAVRLNVEMVVLLALFFLFGIGPDLAGIFWPAAASSPARVASGLWVLLLLNGMTVSYGLIYRGHFRDHAALKREMNTYGDEMERYSAFPVVEFSQQEVDLYQDRLAALRKEIEGIWRTEDFFEDPLGGKVSVFGRWMRRRRNPADTGEVLVSLIKADELLEPELIGEVGRITRQIDQLRGEMGNLENRRNEIEGRLAELRSGSGDAVQEIRIRKRSREQQYRSRIAEVSASFFALVSRCQSALSMGSSLRQGISPSQAGEGRSAHD